MQNKPTAHSLISRPALLVLDAPPAPAHEAEVLEAAGIPLEIIQSAAIRGTGERPCHDAPDGLERADFIATWRTPIDAAMIARAARCLLIVHYGPGAGRGVAPVDLEAARQAGIYVASIPDFATGSWAAETFRLLDDVCARRASLQPSPACNRLGLVGFGQVGRAVAREARARRMEVWACDPFAPDEPFQTGEVHRADLANLCGIAEVLSLHGPLGPATRGMIGADQLALLKTGSILINTAAPELVDGDALADGLRRGKPATAAFDEDLAPLLPPGHPLLVHPGLVHGPRRAGMGPGDAAACRRRVGELIRDVLHGRRPPHLLIDPPCPRHILLQAER